MQSVPKNELKFFFKDLIGDFFYFPLWWYTVGLKRIALICVASVTDLADRWALKVWVKNIFVPMFGEYDWQGRIISFFMRLFQIIIRSILVGIWIVIVSSLFLFWLALPVFILSQILWHWTTIFKM